MGSSLFSYPNYSIAGKITEPQLTPLSSVHWLMFITGVALIVIAAIASLAGMDLIRRPTWTRVRSTPTGFVMAFGLTAIHIDFGLLEKIYPVADQGAIAVLPVKEFFDEQCFIDVKTASGAFIQSHFIAKARQLIQMISSDLALRKITMIEKEPGIFERSYGVGTSVYVSQPLGIACRLVFAAVATKRATEGLRSEFAYILQAIEAVRQIAADNRLTTIYLPLLGAGKGGLPPRVALFTALLAFSQSVARGHGYHMKEVHVVVYCPQAGSEEVSRRNAKRTLSQVFELFREASV